MIKGMEKKIRSLFMSYDSWFKYKNFNEKYYNNEGTWMLYKDRFLPSFFTLLVCVSVIACIILLVKGIRLL